MRVWSRLELTTSGKGSWRMRRSYGFKQAAWWRSEDGVKFVLHGEALTFRLVSGRFESIERLISVSNAARVAMVQVGYTTRCRSLRYLHSLGPSALSV